MSSLSMGSVPTGTIVAFFSNTKPVGWLFCNGEEIPPQYTELKELLNSNNTPNLIGRTLIGAGTAPQDNEVQVDQKKPNFSTGAEWAIGDTGGEYQHVLTIEELPPHEHNFSGYNANYHQSGDNTTKSGDDISAPDCSSWSTKETEKLYNFEGKAHYTMQPYVAINYIIYTGLDE